LKRIIAILALVIVATYWFWPRAPQLKDLASAQMDTRESASTRREGVSSETSVAVPVLAAVSAESERLLNPQASASDDLEVMTVLVAEYRRLLGGNPVGDNDEITAALAGNNRSHIAMLTTQVFARVAPQGQWLDRWGMPYFFHARSGTSMGIISSGPDGILHTADDLHGGDPE
jgi:hypothetical protein